MDFEIHTDRLYLRPVESSDAELMWPYVTDPEIAKYMSWEPHQNIEETREFVRRLQRDKEEGKGFTWSIFWEDDFCGIFSIIAIAHKHRALTYDKGELAYWCASGLQGKGIMSEAGKAVVRFAFEELGLHRLVVSHFAENTHSEKLIKRLGFRFVGTEREAFKKDGVWHDHLLYEQLEKEYYGQE